MNSFNFDNIGNTAIAVRFQCDECETTIESDEIRIPSPDFSAETTSDSQTENYGEAVCPNPKCGKEFTIDIFSTFSGGSGCINELPDDKSVEIIETPDPDYETEYDAIFSNTDFFLTFQTEINNLDELNKITLPNPLVEMVLKRQIFVGVITAMEAYLSAAFIHTTLNKDEYTEKFVATFKAFKDRKITLSEVFKVHKTIKDFCKKEMLDIVYHRLSVVKNMYKDTLNVDIGDIAEVAKAVNIRHDLVHRSGATKEGKGVSIDKAAVDKLIATVVQFIEAIELQIVLFE